MAGIVIAVHKRTKVEKELKQGRLVAVGAGRYYPHPSAANRAIKSFRANEFDNPHIVTGKQIGRAHV